MKSMKILFASAFCLVMLGMHDCKKDHKNEEVKVHSNKKSKKKNKKNSSKKMEVARALPEAKVENMSFFEEEETNIASLQNDRFVDEFDESKELEKKALAAEKEIQRLIAMLEEENKKLKENECFDQPFETVFFDSESRDISSNQLSVMKENKKKALAAAREGRKVVVRGHSDIFENQSNEVENINLAKKRAEAVKQELIKDGIPEDKIELAAMGTSQPLVIQDLEKQGDDSKNLYNRRVEILTI